MKLRLIARAPWIVLILLAAFAVQTGTAVATKSSTWDETNYFGMGDYLLKHRQWDVPSSVIHPPLAYYLDSIPLLWADLDRRVWDYPSDDRTDLAFLGAADIARGQSLLRSPANADDRLLTQARVMVILQALLLGVMIYRTATILYGAPAGLLATMFFAFCPNMLAHGALITPDMTLTVFCFMTLALFRQSMVHGGLRYHLMAGVSLGLALLSKFPALLLLPIEGVIIAFMVWRGRRPLLSHLGLAWLCAAVVVIIGYAGDPTPYLLGLTIQSRAAGHWSYLMGQLSSQGWWYYVLVAFVLKTPLPLLACLAGALGMVIHRAVRRTLTVDDLIVWLPIITFVVFFSIELRSIGLRYVLPIYPFVFVAAAGAVVQIRRWRAFVLAALLWYPAANVATWPHYLAYFNEIAGGPSQGYRYLVDSNLDWGQDLKGLKAFMQARGIDRVYLSYFGTDAPERYGIAYDWLPSYQLKNPNPQATNVNIRRGSYVAISVTNLQGVYMEPQSLFRWLDRYTPVARIGHSIFVFYVD